MRKFEYNILALYVKRCEYNGPIDEEYFDFKSLNKKLIRAIEVREKGSDKAAFYKILAESKDEDKIYLGFNVSSLNLGVDPESISNIVFQADIVTTDNISDFELDSEDYRNFDKWIKNKNLDLYRELFERMSDRVTNHIFPYYMFIEEDAQEGEDGYEEDLVYPSDYIEKINEILEDEDQNEMMDTIDKLSVLKETDQDKYRTVINVIKYI